MDVLGVHKINSGNNRSNHIIDYDNVIRIPAKTAAPIISSVPKCRNSKSTRSHHHSTKVPNASSSTSSNKFDIGQVNYNLQSGSRMDDHQFTSNGGGLVRGRGRASSNENQVLLIVQDDHIKGGGIPVLGRRLPSKSINLDETNYLLSKNRHSLLSKQIHLDTNNDDEIRLINYKPTTSASHIVANQAPVVGRRTHRIMQQQQQQILYLNDQLDLEQQIDPSLINSKVYLLDKEQHKKVNKAKQHYEILSMIANQQKQQQQAFSMESGARIIEQYTLPPMVKQHAFNAGHESNIKHYLLTEATTTSKPQKLSTANKSRSTSGPKLLQSISGGSSASCSSLCANQELLLDCPHCYHNQNQSPRMLLSPMQPSIAAPGSFENLSIREKITKSNNCCQLLFKTNDIINNSTSYGLCCEQTAASCNNKNLLSSSTRTRHLSEQNINHNFVTTNQNANKLLDNNLHHQSSNIEQDLSYACQVVDCNQQQQYLLHNRLINTSKPPAPLPAGVGAKNCYANRQQSSKQHSLIRSSNNSKFNNNKNLLSEEASNVNQMYESLAAELKAKLGDPKMGPILLPPKDYDTMSRKQGKLNGIELRRSTNPQLVGPNIALRQQTNNNSNKDDNNKTLLADHKEELDTGSLQRSRSISSSGLGSISMGATSNNSSPSSKASSSEDIQNSQQLIRSSDNQSIKRTSSDQTTSKQFLSDNIMKKTNNNNNLLSRSPIERKDYSPDNCAGSDSGHSGSARLDSALSNDEQSNDTVTSTNNNNKLTTSRNNNIIDNNNSNQNSTSSLSSHSSAINNVNSSKDTREQKSLRGKGIHDYNPSKVSDGILWNGRVEVPLKVNSNKNDGNTYLATKQIIY